MEIIVWVALAVLASSGREVQILTSDELFRNKEDCEVAQAKAKDEIMKIKEIKAFGLECVPVKVATKYNL